MSEPKRLGEIFTLEIALGNDAMGTYDDLAACLRRAATRLSGYGDEIPTLDDEAALADDYGNTVGKWVVS